MARDVGQSVFHPVATTATAYTGTAGNSAAVAAGIKAVRVVCTTAAFVAVGKGVTAVSTDMPMAAGVPEIFLVQEGDRVSAIQQSSGGNVHVTTLV